MVGAQKIIDIKTYECPYNDRAVYPLAVVCDPVIRRAVVGGGGGRRDDKALSRAAVRQQARTTVGPARVQPSIPIA